MLAIFSEVHTYCSDKKTHSMKVESNGAPKSGNDLWRSSVSIAAKCKSSQAYMLLVLWLGTKRGIWWGRFFFDEKATVLHLINECTKKIVVLILLLRCDYYYSDIWIYWQILKIVLAVFDKKKDQYYNSSIAFLTSFFCSHHHWATLKTKHKPHQISDFVTFFFSAFFSTNQSLFDVRIPHEMRQYFNNTHQSWHKSSNN